MCTASTLVLSLLACCGESSRGEECAPFGGADMAPADVRVYVHVEDAAGLRRELGERPFAAWIHARLKEGDIQHAWESLARHAELGSDELFDLALGRRFTVLVRGGDDDCGRHEVDLERSQWSLLSSVSDDVSRNLLRALRTKTLGPRHGLAIHELPEHELILAAGSGVLVAGPIEQAGLFNDVLRCLNDEVLQRLMDDPALQFAGQLGPGRVGVFARHDPPLGGWSAAVAGLEGDRLSIRHSARFDQSPFTSPISTTRIDLAPIEALRQHAIIAIAEPAELGEGLLGTFLALQFPMMTPELHVCLGDQRLNVVGESDGRQLNPPVDLLVPTFARCYELKSTPGAAKLADEAMLGLIDTLNEAGAGEYHIDAPAMDLAPDQPRSADVGHVARSILKGLPIADHVSLNWQVIEGGPRDWFVVASHPDLLRDVSRALSAAQAAALANDTSACWSSCGVVQGPRVAQHVRTWIRQAKLLADPEQTEEFRTALEPLADLGDCLRTTRWCLTRPTLNTMQLELAIILTGDESAAHLAPGR